LNSPAAIGERTEFIPQANSTACGRAEREAAIALNPSSAARRSA
jgi:hypothetical protein